MCYFLSFQFFPPEKHSCVVISVHRKQTLDIMFNMNVIDVIIHWITLK